VSAAGTGTLSLIAPQPGPITLALVMIAVGARVGLRLHGIGLPGHFLVGYRPPEASPTSLAGARLFDPFHRGQLVAMDETSGAQLWRAPTGSYPDGIAYAHIWMFSDRSARLARTMLSDAVAHGATRIILDLRDNPGGSVDNAAQVASLFTQHLPLAMLRSKTDRGTIDPDPAITPLKVPTTILIDGGSASASEFLAAALQDAHAATVVGQRSAGSIGAAEHFGLDDGSGLEITVSQVLRATGAPLDNAGVLPDVSVRPSDATFSNGHDLALDVASGATVSVAVGQWVETISDGVVFWSGSDAPAVAFGPQPQGSRFEIAASPIGTRVLI